MVKRNLELFTIRREIPSP